MSGSVMSKHCYIACCMLRAVTAGLHSNKDDSSLETGTMYSAVYNSTLTKLDYAVCSRVGSCCHAWAGPSAGGKGARADLDLHLTPVLVKLLLQFGGLPEVALQLAPHNDQPESNEHDDAAQHNGVDQPCQHSVHKSAAKDAGKRWTKESKCLKCHVAQLQQGCVTLVKCTLHEQNSAVLLTVGHIGNAMDKRIHI